MLRSTQIEIENYYRRWHRINKVHTKVRMKGGGIRYYSLKYLKFIIDVGTCKITSEPSWINLHLEYVQEFLPKMESEGWTRESVVFEPFVVSPIQDAEESS